MSVKAAQREIDSAEFTEWMASQQLDPFDSDMQMINTAHVCATMANILLPKENKRLWTWEELLVAIDRKPSRLEEQLSTPEGRTEAINQAIDATDRYFKMLGFE